MPFGSAKSNFFQIQEIDITYEPMKARQRTNYVISKSSLVPKRSGNFKDNEMGLPAV
jgi:hypothetical protein